MNGWKFYHKRWRNEPGFYGEPYDAPVLTVGSTQLALMLRARSSSSGTLVLTHGRSANRERMAARRLVERGLLAGPNFMGAAAGVRNYRGVRAPGTRGMACGLYVYTLTEKGRTAWLRAKI